MVAFYWSVVAYIFLVFDYINYAFPNPLNYYPTDPYQSGISFEMASIIILMPLSLILLRIIRNNIVRDPSRKEIWVRRWALIMTLFVAGATITVDLIVLLTTFLNGEDLTTSFLLKVLVLFIVAGAVFLHFIADFREYWDKFPSRRRMVSIGSAIIALATVIAGFFIIGTPVQARLMRFDEQKVSDLQTIQTQVMSYYQAKQKLPAALTDINTSLSYSPLPVDPQTGKQYMYQATGALSFSLCATFNAKSRDVQMIQNGPNVPYAQPAGTSVPADIINMRGVAQNNWQHGSGSVCFDRTVDPSYYPPLK